MNKTTNRILKVLFWIVLAAAAPPVFFNMYVIVMSLYYYSEFTMQIVVSRIGYIMGVGLWPALLYYLAYIYPKRKSQVVGSKYKA